MGGRVKGFSVTITRKEVVAAALPLQEHLEPLSNLDLMLPTVDVGVYFYYRKPLAKVGGQKRELTFASAVGVLKKSLAQALATYYALAGEVIDSSVGEPELLCNNRGVDFIEAYADVELRDLHLSNPDESVEEKLVPKKKEGVLCVQVTELKCGGLVVACTFDHRIADAYSANMFFVSWAEGARGNPISLPPSFRKSLLCPRRPVPKDPSFDQLYVPLSSLPPPKDADSTAEPPLDRIYYITADDIERIQALSSTGAQRRTKLEAFSAYMWRIVGGGARRGGRVCRMGVVVDGRSRMGEGGDAPMAAYFGNVLSTPYGSLTSDELEAMGVDEVAGFVHEFLRGAVTREHFLGLIDWIEAHRPERIGPKIYCVGDEDDSTAFMVSSGQRFPVSQIDFGWGRPVFGSYHFPWGSSAGYVMPMPSVSGNGDWVVYAHMPREQIQALEADAAGDVFRPLTWEHLGLIDLPGVDLPGSWSVGQAQVLPSQGTENLACL